MELSEIIIGTKLNEIQKKSDDVKLVFEDTKTNKVYVLTFDGLLFETSNPALNRRVKDIRLNSTLGFRAMSQLTHLNRNPNDYRQLFIQMEGSNDNNKLELLGALRNYKLSSRRQPTLKTKPTVKKPSVKGLTYTKRPKATVANSR